MPTVMITKEVWGNLTAVQRKEQLAAALTELCEIDDGKHALSGKPEQGRLTQIKKDLEGLVTNIIEWEKPEYEENRPSA